MKIRQYNSYLAIPKSIDLESSIQDLVDQLDSYGLPKPALDRFTSDITSCDTKGELGSTVNRLRPEIEKFYKGGSWVSIEGESKFMYPNEIAEEYKKANDEYSKAVKEVKGKYGDRRLEKARERRDQAFQNVNSAIETTASSVVKFGSGMLSGNPDQMIDAGLNALGDILKILSKSIASSILKIAKTYDKVRNGDEFSKAEMKELKDIEKRSIEIHTATPNEFPDFDAYVTPMSEDDYEEIKDEQDSIAQANFDEVGEITDWESAFKYGKAKLKQIHGLKYDESKATEVLEGLKAKYPDTPQCVIGALKYGGFHRKRNENSTPFSNTTSVHGWKFNVYDCSEVTEHLIKSLDEVDYPPLKDIFKRYFDSIKDSGPNCVWICEKFITEHELMDSYVVYGMYNPYNYETYALHAVIELGGTYYDLRSMYEKYKGQGSLPYSRFFKYRSLSRVDLLEINKNMKNTRKYNSANEFTIHEHKFSKSECQPLSLYSSRTPLTSVNDLKFGNYPTKVKSALNKLESNLDSIEICERFYQSGEYDSTLIYGIYSPKDDGNYTPYALLTLRASDGDTSFVCDLKSMYDEVRGNRPTKWSGDFQFVKLFGMDDWDRSQFRKYSGKDTYSVNSKVAGKWIEVEDILLLRNPDMTDDQLSEAIKELEVESNGDFDKAKRLAAESNRKLNSANEFTIHGVKFSKADCRSVDLIPKSTLSEIPSENNYPTKVRKALQNMGPGLDSLQVCEEYEMKGDRDAMVIYGLYSPNKDGNYIPYAIVCCYLPSGGIFDIDLKSIYDEMNGGKPQKWSGDFLEWKASYDWTLPQYKKFISNNSVYRGRNSSSADGWKSEFEGMCAVSPSRFNSFDEFYAYCEKHPDLCSDEDLMEIDKKFQELYRR